MEVSRLEVVGDTRQYKGELGNRPGLARLTHKGKRCESLSFSWDFADCMMLCRSMLSVDVLLPRTRRVSCTHAARRCGYGLTE